MQRVSILADRLFDGTSFHDEPLRIDIERGHIAAVRPLVGATPAEDGVEVVDARGVTVLPGLIDAHCHAARVGLFEPDEVPNPAAVVANLAGALARGVTTLGDMGCTAPMARALRRLGESHTDAPAIRSAGPLLADPLGYPLDWMGPMHRRLGVVIPVADEREARAGVARVAALGMDHVKLCIMHKSYAYQPLHVFSRSTARAIVDEAHACGLRAFAHAHSDADYGLALDAGVDALMHSAFDPLEEKTVARVRDAGIPVCATLWVFHSACLGAEERWDRDGARAHGVTRPVRRSWRRFADAYAASGDVLPPGIAGGVPKERAREGVRNAAANLVLLHDAGVPIAHGSDGPYGFSMLGRPRDELGALHAAGLDVTACLRAATASAADLLGAKDRGRIAPGARADLVVLDGDPRRGLDAIERVRAVFRGGRRVDTGARARAPLAGAVARGFAATLADALRG
jgi:imidazolonepropionase-like amidohydrolase